MRGSMYFLIFLRISAAMLHGRRKMSCNFTQILKAQRFHVVCCLIRYFVHNFVELGFAIAEYNDWPIFQKRQKKRGGDLKKTTGGGGGGGGVCYRILSRKINSNPRKISPLSRICLKKLRHVCTGTCMYNHPLKA